MANVEPQEYYETKSEYEYARDIEAQEQTIFQQFRTHSLPLLSHESERKVIERFIILRVNELRLDINKAMYILDSLQDEEFMENREDRILQKVVQAILLMESYIEATNRAVQREYIKELRDLIGIANPNLMTYLGYKDSVRQSQQLLIETCLIHMDQIEGLPSEHCQKHTVCKPCIKEYLTQRIINGQVEKIMCPQSGCGTEINEQFILDIVGQEMLDKMIKFRKVKQLQLDPNIIWCPRPGCEEVVRLDQSKKLKCKCGQRICKKCGREYHQGQSCSEQLDQDFKKAIKKLKIQKCEKCKSPIQKNDGCNHMTCKQCHYEFCWLCRSKFTHRHYSTYNIFGCPGMQFAHKDPFLYPNLYRFLAIILLLILGPPLFVAFIVVGFVVLVIGLPWIAYMTYVPSYVFAEYGCLRKTIYSIGLTILCPLLSPISLVLVCLGIVAAIIIGIPYGIYLFIDWLRYG